MLFKAVPVIVFAETVPKVIEKFHKPGFTLQIIIICPMGNIIEY